MVQIQAGGRRRLIVFAVLFLMAGLTVADIGVHQADAAVTAVKGSACGYYTNVGLFGGPQNLRGCGQTAGGPTSASPFVTLPPAGSASPITADDPDGAKATYGPAAIFAGIWPADVAGPPPSGPISVSTAGTPAAGSVTSTADIKLLPTPITVPCATGFPPPCTAPGGFGPGPFEGNALHSECTSTESSATGSVTFDHALLTTTEDSGGSPVAQEPVPDHPPVNYTRSAVITNVGDVFTVVYNQQIVGPDGSLTVTAVHAYLFGPTAVGELVEGQVTCGTTPSSVSGADTVAPSCGIPVIEPNGPDDPTPKVPRVELIGVFDAGNGTPGSGLESISNIQATNATVQLGNPGSLPPPIPPYLTFVPGQTGPLSIIATQTDTSMPITWSFDATDKAGNVSHCLGINPPRVTALFPSSGPEAGGTQVVVNGTGFTGATAVTFGTTAATAFTIDSDTQITATAPAHAAGVVDVSVVTPSGTLTTPAGSGYTYGTPPPPSTTTSSSTIPGSTTTSSSTIPGSTTTSSSTVPGSTTTSSSTVPGSTTTTSSVPGSTTTTTVVPTICDTATSTTVPSAGNPTADASPSSVTAGDDTTVTGGGFDAGDTLDFTLCSTPVSLGTATADDAGDFSATLTIPAGTAGGDHTIVVTNADKSLFATANLSVTASSGGDGTGTDGGTSALSRTGTDAARMAWFGGMALLVGAFLVRVARRRRRAHASPHSRR